MENDTQIPIPTRSETAPQVYHFYKLSVGDHMDITSAHPDNLKRVRGAASIYGKRNNKTFVTRSVYHEGRKILRLWRTK
jgi:hypothetical protein